LGNIRTKKKLVAAVPHMALNIRIFVITKKTIHGTAVPDPEIMVIMTKPPLTVFKFRVLWKLQEAATDPIQIGHVAAQK